MAYVVGNPRTKKLLKEWLKDGKSVEVYQPGPFGPEVGDGSVVLEGPHYPKPHSWYATGMVKGGVLVSVK
jgi:hypothetical protein